MIQRGLRLPRAEFASLSRGERLTSPHFSISVASNAGKGGCAAVVSKKVAAKAVDRHRVKRHIFEVLKPFCSSHRALVVYAKSGVTALSFTALKGELESLLGTLGAHP